MNGKSSHHERDFSFLCCLNCISVVFTRFLKMVLLQPDPFLNELTNMYERNREKGSVWVTLKRSSLKSKRKRKVEYATDVVDFRCLVRATDGKKTISTSLSAKDHLRFQASYATLLRAHMHALKKRERKDKKKAVSEVDKKLQQQVAAKKTPPKPKN